MQRRLAGVAGRAGGEDAGAFALGVLEMPVQDRGVGELEIVAGIFLLGLQEDVAIGDLLVALAAVEVEVVDVVDVLDIHRQPLQPVGQLAGHRRAFDAADLLEIGELRDFHAVAPAFPAEAPGAQRRAFPVVLDEADVVEQRIDADRLAASRDRAPAGSTGSASGSPDTGSNAAAGWDSRRSGRPSAGATAAHRPRSTASARAPAASSPDGRCRRRPPCRRAAARRSRNRPSSGAASGSAPGRNGAGPYGGRVLT